LGSDRYRHLRGPVCQCRPIRKDYLDELVREQVVGLLRAPELVRAEIDRRLEESLSTYPMQQRKIRLERELKRIGSQLDKLLDAYDLRSRAPELRRRQAAIEKELEGVALQALEKTRLTQLNASIENFLAGLQQSAKTLEIVERQKIVRLVIKQIIVNGDTLTIHHSIPISRGSQQSQLSTSYLLCTRSPSANMGDWKVVGTADVNGDGKTEILWQSKSTGQVAAWLMDGAGHAIGTVWIASTNMGDWQVNGRDWQ
jgi:site-specific DNA recombinase